MPVINTFKSNNILPCYSIAGVHTLGCLGWIYEKSLYHCDLKKKLNMLVVL